MEAIRLLAWATFLRDVYTSVDGVLGLESAYLQVCTLDWGVLLLSDNKFIGQFESIVRNADSVFVDWICRFKEFVLDDCLAAHKVDMYYRTYSLVFIVYFTNY